jgi:protein tyrosine/serine phosphatase
MLVSAAAAPPLTDVTAKVSIANFGQVSSTYYRGAQPEGRDYADLAASGIKAVVDLQEYGQEDEQRLVEAAGMAFHRIRMNTRVPPTAEQLASFLTFVNDPANQPVFVHCAGGRHRTGVMTAVYRLSHDHWTSDQAFKEMKKYKFGADFLHPEFKKFVYAYHVDPTPATPVQIADAAVAVN